MPCSAMSFVALSLLSMTSLSNASEFDKKGEMADGADDADDDGGVEVEYDDTPPPTFKDVINMSRRLLDPKIVGGEEVTDIDRFPWLTLLIIDGSMCGGSLIGPKDSKSGWVISAAHCFQGVNKKNIYVFYRRLDRNKGWKDEKAIRKQVRKIYNHPRYNSQTLFHDMTLLKLKGKITQHQTNVKLPFDLESVNFDGQTVRIAGWGTTASGGSVSPKMKTAEVPLVTNTQCKAWLGESMVHKKWNICAGFEIGGTDACQGDSGGPLFIEQNADTVVVIGVVSWGFGCAGAQKPGVYASIKHEKGWIMKKTKWRGNHALWYKSSRRLLEESHKDDTAPVMV